MFECMLVYIYIYSCHEFSRRRGIPDRSIQLPHDRYLDASFAALRESVVSWRRVFFSFVASAYRYLRIIIARATNEKFTHFNPLSAKPLFR